MIVCNSKEKAEELKTKIMQYRFKDSEKVIELCTALESYAFKNDDKDLLGFSYLFRGEAYYILNDIETMFQNIARAIAFLNPSNQWDLIARAYNMMAITSINKGNAPVAIDYYLIALKCTQNHDCNPIQCSIHINLGFLYMQNGLYREAQNHFLDAHKIYCQTSDKEQQIARLIMIYTNLATCYMLRGDIDIAATYVSKLDLECESYYTDMDYVYVGCMKAIYFDKCNEPQKRDAVIADILSRLDSQMPLLDLFDDLYSLCELAFSLEKYDVFIEIINRLDSIMSDMNIIYLESKLLKLKIKYYKLMNMTDKYVSATSHFFELISSQEDENKKMIANMLSVRTAYENTKERKREIELANAILTQKSETDQLTGLANRYRLTDYSQEMMDECITSEIPYAVEILDIDYFKEYNDNYGHQAGDECIKKVAGLISQMQDVNTFCARYGGDEFIIIYKGLEENEVLQKAIELKNNILALNLKHEYSKALPVVTISQGVCVSVPVSGNKSWDFLHIADEYLYNVKKENRNGICIGNIKGASRINQQ